MKKNYMWILSLLLGAALTALRFLQYRSGYDPKTRLFEAMNPYSSLVVGLALLAGVLFIVLSRLGPSERPDTYVKADKFTKFSGEIFLQCAIVLALARLFMLFNGKVTGLLDVIILIFSIFLPIYGVGIAVLYYKSKEKGLTYLSLIPVLALMVYLVFGYVPITEMASFHSYVLHILSACALLVFFFMAAKSMLYRTTGRRAAAIGYLGAVYVAAESVAYPLYSLTGGVGDITVGAVAASWLMGWGLVIFLLGYSRHLSRN